jgi:N4-(beta-N-acetylglucosaminyl)-L-asparaginase
MGNLLNRRDFLAATSTAAGAASLALGAMPEKPVGSRRPIVVCSGSPKVVEIAMARIKAGADPLDAAIEGVAVVEADPNDHSVGYGGTPNEEGVVELDAAVMHGATHGAAGVAGLRNIVHPAAVARMIMQRTRHVLMVGDNALKFAREHGFPEIDLTTEVTRKAWIQWKEEKLRGNRYPVAVASLDAPARAINEQVTHGTVHCSVLDTHGDLACTTTTSGLGYKVPGRVGDSPIIGAGLYLDNTVGSCGSVGLGELNLVNCACFLLVEFMRQGKSPKDAIAAVLKRINETTPRDPRFRGPDGKLNAGVSFYAVTKDGRIASLALDRPATYYVHDGDRMRTIETDVMLA